MPRFIIIGQVEQPGLKPQSKDSKGMNNCELLIPSITASKPKNHFDLLWIGANFLQVQLWAFNYFPLSLIVALPEALISHLSSYNARTMADNAAQAPQNIVEGD